VSSAEGLAGLTILVPARNEEQRIALTVEALRGDFPGAEVIVVDGRSEDRTAERAEAAGAAVRDSGIGL
jgi:glycosyltransferase involved in cell wall biosynthesis